MNKKLELKIFIDNLNTKFKSMIFNKKQNDIGLTRYLPPYSKEWNSTAYFYNKNNLKNISINNNLMNKIIKNYFNMFYLNYKYIELKKRRNFLKDIYISNAKIRYSNSVAIITLYTINLRKYLFNKYFNSFNYYSISKKWKRIWDKETQSWVLKNRKSNALIIELKRNFLRFIKIETNFSKDFFKLSNQNNIINTNNTLNWRKILSLKFKLFNKGLIYYNLYKKIYLIKEIKHMYYKYLMVLYKYNYQYTSYNFKYKNENNSFIPKLKSKLSRLFNKRIELNVINLKSILNSPDILTQALTKKLKKRSFNLVRSMVTILNKGKIIEKNYIEDKIVVKNDNILENKFKNLDLVSVLDNKNNIESILEENFFIKKDSNKNLLKNIIFNNIKYKNIGGIRLEVKGRLTKRYRADRAVYKLRWKGGLKNIDSSFKGLSTVLYRGNLKPNVLYSISKSKRRIGSFAVKGWVSGK